MIKLSTSTTVLTSPVSTHADVSGTSYWEITYNHNLGEEPDNVVVWYSDDGVTWYQRYDMIWWQDIGGNARYYGWQYLSTSTYNTAVIRMYRAGIGGTVYAKVKVSKVS